jgi:hypothetical protein
MFRKSVLYCEHCFGEWFVLSAKHGLVRPDQVIEYYELKFAGLSRPAQREWGRMVSNQLLAIGHDIEFYGLAPDPYLRAIPDVPIINLLKGLRQGERQQWLVRQLRSFGLKEW